MNGLGGRPFTKLACAVATLASISGCYTFYPSRTVDNPIFSTLPKRPQSGILVIDDATRKYTAREMDLLPMRGESFVVGPVVQELALKYFREVFDDVRLEHSRSSADGHLSEHSDFIVVLTIEEFDNYSSSGRAEITLHADVIVPENEEARSIRLRGVEGYVPFNFGTHDSASGYGGRVNRAIGTALQRALAELLVQLDTILDQQEYAAVMDSRDLSDTDSATIP